MVLGDVISPGSTHMAAAIAKHRPPPADLPDLSSARAGAPTGFDGRSRLIVGGRRGVIPASSRLGARRAPAQAGGKVEVELLVGEVVDDEPARLVDEPAGDVGGHLEQRLVMRRWWAGGPG